MLRRCTRRFTRTIAREYSRTLRGTAYIEGGSGAIVRCKCLAAHPTNLPSLHGRQSDLISTTHLLSANSHCARSISKHFQHVQHRFVQTDGSEPKTEDKRDEAYTILMECAGGSPTKKLEQHINRYLDSTGVVGITVEDVVERATTLKSLIDLTDIEATRLALTVPFISDVSITENGVRVAKLLQEHGVDIAEVLGTQPGLLYVPESLVQSRLDDLLAVGILPKDLERIITANPAVLCHNVKKDVFRLAKYFNIEHDSKSTMYTTIMRALRRQLPLRLIGKSDEAKLRTIWNRLKDFQISVWVKQEKCSVTRLLKETSDSIEVKLALLQERPLCLDLVEQSQFIAEDPQVFVDLDQGTMRDRVRHLRTYLGDIRELRETVIRHPVLVSRAPWPSAAAYLTDIGVDPATVCSAPRFGHAPEHALPDTSAREDHIQIVGSCGLCGHSDSMVASFGRGLSVDVFCSGRQDFQSEISSCCFVKVRSASFVAELLGINTLPDSAALSQYNGISFS
eukprot:m.428435 g.428435  ORF g.428435 m.428435 type:complete len:510 (-) comp21378_c1_seq8:67-1596(-)